MHPVHQPCRADQKELEIFEKSRLLTFEMMSEKLPGPSQDKESKRRPEHGKRACLDAQDEDRGKKRPETDPQHDGDGKPQVINGDHYHHHHGQIGGWVPCLGTRYPHRHTPEQTDQARDDQRDAKQMNAPIDGILMKRFVSLNPILQWLDSSHASSESSYPLAHKSHGWKGDKKNRPSIMRGGLGQI